MPESDTPTVLSQAITFLGGTRGVAKKLNISYQAVDKWHTRISAERARDIQMLTKGKFTLKALRPDLFPEESLQS